MTVTYDPETQGKTLSVEKQQQLIQLVPDFSAFSLDEPELTDELVSRMKRAKREGKQGKFSKKKQLA